MPSNSPPDGWRVETGTWGTDVRRTETISVTGGASVEMDPGTSLVSDWGPVGVVNEFFRPSLACWTVLQCSDTSTPITFELQEAVKDRTTPYGSAVLFSGSAASAATWFLEGKVRTVAASNAWYRIRFSTLGGGAGTWTIGCALVELSKPAVQHIGAAAGGAALIIGSWVTVPLNTATLVVQNVAEIVSNGIQLREPGNYVASCSVPIDEMDDGDIFEIRFTWSSNLLFPIVASGLHNGPTIFASAAFASAGLYLNVSAPLWVNANSLLQCEVRQLAGTARNIDPTQSTYFRVAKVGR